MGGFGALYIGISFPEIFGLVGSSCGALDFRTFNEGYNNYQVDKVLGPLSSLGSDYILSDNTDKMLNTGQYYILDCGINDFFISKIKIFIRSCLIKIEHLYIESLGEHNTKYWSRALSNQLSLFENFLLISKNKTFRINIRPIINPERFFY